MSRRLAILIALILTGPAPAAEWKTPDGKIAVDAPDETRFVAAGPDAETLASWRSQDGALLMMMAEMVVPPNVVLDQSSLEQGMMKEVNRGLANGRLVSSAVETRGGHRVFAMTSRGDRDGAQVYFTQVITHVGGKSYKAAVMGFGRDTQSEPDAIRFIASFKILAADAPPNSPAPGQPGQGGQRDPAANVAYQMGRVAGMVLFVALVLWVWRRLTGGGRDRSQGRRKRDADDDDS